MLVCGRGLRLRVDCRVLLGCPEGIDGSPVGGGGALTAPLTAPPGLEAIGLVAAVLIVGSMPAPLVAVLPAAN